MLFKSSALPGLTCVCAAAEAATTSPLDCKALLLFLTRVLLIWLVQLICLYAVRSLNECNRASVWRLEFLGDHCVADLSGSSVSWWGYHMCSSDLPHQGMATVWGDLIW